MTDIGTVVPPVTPPVVPPVTLPNPWYHGVPGVDNEIIGHWQNRGWTSKTAAEVAVEATRAHREAERYIGAPADQIVRLPKDRNDEAGWNAVYARLGAPADPKDYDFSTVKAADGSAPSTNLIDLSRSLAAKLHLPKDQAAILAADVLNFNTSVAAAARTEQEAALANEKVALAKNWGANHEANLFVARQAATKLGIDPAAVQALEGQIGYAKVMEMFRSIGARIGEDRFVASDAPGGAGGVKTREQAVAEKADLMKDKAWAKSYLDGDPAKLRQMQALNTIITAGMTA